MNRATLSDNLKYILILAVQFLENYILKLDPSVIIVKSAYDDIILKTSLIIICKKTNFYT